ncbi:hypothetical protein D3OALGA1CA_1602 [Olavius algarvensis associated proteobacterium Delta 3]|nr:hypothetical protein D3OALGA1CA_1602 [Olavius algarvensis associated proteobacterium Delta 3]
MSSTISTSSIADITFSFEWDSATGHHTEVYEAHGVDFWRDLLPEAMRDAMLGQSPGGSISVNARNNGIFPEDNLDQRFRIMRRQFRESVRGTVVRPRIGRYYPRGLLKDLPGIYPQNVIPFRMIDIRNGSLHVDFNHPMAGKTIHLNATIRAVKEKTVERGVPCGIGRKFSAPVPVCKDGGRIDPPIIFQGTPLIGKTRHRMRRSMPNPAWFNIWTPRPDPRWLISTADWCLLPPQYWT